MLVEEFRNVLGILIETPKCSANYSDFIVVIRFI